MAALVFTLLLAGPVASGEATGWESVKGSGRIWQGLEDLWRWAQEVVSFETADKGISVDPNGATADSDKGSSIDPDGQAILRRRPLSASVFSLDGISST